MQNFKLNRFLIPFGFLLIAFLAIYFSLTVKNVKTPTNQGLEQKQLQIAGKILTVEVAKTKAQVEQGLSDRVSLGENSGMYFELGEKRFVTFWMKDMHFPLDIIWLDSGRVVGIEKNAQIPQNEIIPAFKSPTEVTNVLEVNAGFSEINNLRTGDMVKLK